MYKSIRLAKKPRALKVIPIHSLPKGARPQLPRWAQAHAGCAAALTAGSFLGDAGTTAMVGSTHLLVGLGPTEGFGPDRMRAVGAALGRTLVKSNANAVEIVGIADWCNAKSRAAIACALAQGISLGTWRFDDLDGTASRREPRKAPLSLWLDEASAREGFARGLVIATGANTTRRIAATPPNIAHPGWIASQARAMGRTMGMKVRVIDDKQARKLGMGGLDSVGRGSAQKPCLVVIEWNPRKIAPRNRAHHVVLVGKTITYDTGGYSLKVNNGMKGMKYDKCGGAAVLGAMQAIAALKLPIRVTAVLAVAENMVSHDAYRPDDIIRLHNGVTVEVTNTDAEGRLVLADALSWSCKELAPTSIVDIATLTGGVGVALGNFCAGYFCLDEGLSRRVEGSATATGELVWKLPLWPAHRDFMRSQHADIINSNPLRSAHPIQGAAFLSYFVDEKIPWAHLDIASMAASDSAHEVTGTGPTGWGVRLLVDLVEQHA